MSKKKCLFFVLLITYFLVLSIGLNISLYFENHFLEMNLDNLIDILSQYQQGEFEVKE